MELIEAEMARLEAIIRNATQLHRELEIRSKLGDRYVGTGDTK